MMCGRIYWAVVVAMLGVNPAAQGQSTAAVPKLTMQGPAEQSGTGVIRDAFGRPCLDVEAAARREVVNSEMLDHIVSIKNNCPRIIKAKVCYFNSDQCTGVELRPYKRVDTILGAMRGINFFRYSVIQK